MTRQCYRPDTVSGSYLGNDRPGCVRTFAVFPGFLRGTRTLGTRLSSSGAPRPALSGDQVLQPETKRVTYRHP